MGLQLRVTHSLGEKLVELEARSADQAIVVGRASNAEVQVPSANISKRHCLLFVHEGRWVVKDADSPSGTFLNGKRVTGPSVVKSGDTVALGGGANPPTLTVDPHHVGVNEEVEEPARPAPAPVASSPRATWAPPASFPSGGGMPPPLMPQPAPTAGFAREDDSDNIFGAPGAPPAPAYVQPGAYGMGGAVPGYVMPAAAPPQDEWGTSTASHRPRRRVVKPKGTSGTSIAIMAVIFVLVLAAGIPLLYNWYKKSIEPIPPKIITLPPRGPGQEKKPGTIFEENPSRPQSGKAEPGTVGPTSEASNAAPEKVKTAPRIAARPAPATSAAPEMEPAFDKRREDPEWDAVERARTIEDPVLAIVRFADYKDRFPDSPNNKDIDRYTDDALDLLWWKRLAELFAERDAARKEIASRKLDISQSSDAEFKKGLEKEIVQFAQARDAAEEIIRNQMKFAAQAPPNLYDSQDLAIARKGRDQKYYEETWKPQVLKGIKSSRGQRLPWSR